MRCEFIGVWSETCREILRPPIDDERAPRTSSASGSASPWWSYSAPIRRPRLGAPPYNKLDH